MISAEITAFWQQFLATLPVDSPLRERGYVAEYFGDNPELADELEALVVAGVKTATCSALWEWEADDEPLPEVGLLTIVLNGQHQPTCIIETTEVEITPFNEVSAQFAYDEGEGDRSYKYWRNGHWNYFSRTLPRLNKAPAEDMPLVCERFQLIYRP